MESLALFMKRLFAALLALLCVSAWASPPTLTTLRAVHSLSNPEAKPRLPVDFEATVTYYDNDGKDLFVQDRDLAIYVFAKPGLHFVPGDRIRVRGKTDSDFRPDVLSDELTLVSHGPVPKSITVATFPQLIRPEMDCLRVTIRAKVRSADIVKDVKERNIYLNLLVDGGYIDATVLGQDASKLKDLLDADVEITGSVAGKFDSKMQLAGIMLEVPSLADVKILKAANFGLASLPITPMDQILGAYNVQDLTQRVRVRGTLTYYRPGNSVVLQEGTRSLWIRTQYEGPLHIGQLVDVTGFPDARDGYSTLTHSEITETRMAAPIAPVSAAWSQLTSGEHAFELVSVEGTVLVAVRGAAQDEYVLSHEGHLFSAIYRHPETDILPLLAMKRLAVGSNVLVTGICTLEYGANPLGAPVAFDVLVRTPDDIAMITGPSLLNVRNLVILVGALLAVVMVVGARGWILEYRMSRQTTRMAARIEAEADMERRRSRILEDINAGQELADILAQITDLVSFKLDGAPCWCQITNGQRYGNCPASLENLTLIREELSSRLGPLHGEIFAALKLPAAPDESALETLAMGARLAALAIETRSLYSDLIHRSEFDLLTDIHNRFSLDKRLETAIEAASYQSPVFGLIYIDLDNFKQVNDVYGHRIGDLYLQQAAHRMKHELRPGDMLARLGGDEFAVLVPMVRSRTDVQEIAARLERCFDSQFAIEGCLLHGSASVGIAIYPEDGTTKDGLLSAADAAMYVSKHTKPSVRYSN